MINILIIQVWFIERKVQGWFILSISCYYNAKPLLTSWETEDGTGI